MNRSSRFAAVAAVVALCATAAACGSNGSGTASGSGGGDGEVFKIGAVAPLSGQFAAVGAGLQEGLELGAKEVNADGGILGKQVEVEVLDSAGDPARGLAAAQQLISKDHVDFLFPDAFPNVVLAILQSTTQNHLVTLTTGSVPDITDMKKYPYSFSIGTPFDAYDNGMADQFKALHAERIGLLVTDDSSGEAFTAVWNKDFPAAGLQIVATEKYNSQATDVTATLQRLRAAEIQAIAFYGAGTQTSAVMQGIEALGWDVPIVAQNASVTGDLSTLVPAGVQDQFRAVALRILGRTSADQVDEQYRDFVAELKKSGAITSLVGSAATRDVVHVVKWAYEKAGSTDQDKVRAALESTEANPPELDLLAGPEPAFSSELHHMVATSYSADNLAVIKPSDPLDGTYQMLSKGN
jgi:branched-chain amino acid transport system substrate-binding protein